MELEKCLPLSSAYYKNIVANVERKMAEEEKSERNKRGPWEKKKTTLKIKSSRTSKFIIHKPKT
jgi:hypothetical protein